MEDRFNERAAKRLFDLRKATGATQEEVAAALGTSQPTIARLETGERNISYEWAAKLADYYGIDADELFPSRSHIRAKGMSSLAIPNTPEKSNETPQKATIVRRQPQFSEPGKMPVYAARGGDEQEMFLEDGAIGYTDIPASLRGVKEPYGIYMVGDSMSPRYEPGWLLHVHPFKPTSPGRDVIVQKKSNAVLVKQLVRRTGGSIILKSINPSYPDQLSISVDDIRHVHLIVGADQEG